MFSLGYIGELPFRATPVNPDRLEALLVRYPNRNMADYLVKGFRFGFDIGYCGGINPGSSRNLKSAREHPHGVDLAIQKEIDRGHTVGPFHSPPFTNFHVLPLGAVPKKDGTYRLIL